MHSTLPEKIRLLSVDIGPHASAGQLLRASSYEYRYLDPLCPIDVALLMSVKVKPTWNDGDLFPVFDQNLPEGALFNLLRARYPKQALSPMHLLALIGQNGIGRLNFIHQESRLGEQRARSMSKKELLETSYTQALFDELLDAYLSTGLGISGMQAKIMLPEQSLRATLSIPNLIVKTGSSEYPNLAANEFLCLSVAKRAGIASSVFDLSHDGQLLILDRFDLEHSGKDEMSDYQRLGFEDIAALAGLRVRDIHSDRKYQGSYQRIAELLKMLQVSQQDIHRFYEQVALSVMVRNGDAHLKNFGVLYRASNDIWLSPVYDVVTTSIYTYEQYRGGPTLTDNTLALKLFAGKTNTRNYPSRAQLLDFGRKICGVPKPEAVLDCIAEAMIETLNHAQTDTRIAPKLLEQMQSAWSSSLTTI